MLVYPDFSPSIRYIKDPKTITIFNTAKKNMNIFLLLATNASIKRLASPIYLTNFKILKILSIFLMTKMIIDQFYDFQKQTKNLIILTFGGRPLHLFTLPKNV